jgi:hypothetical protein
MRRAATAAALLVLAGCSTPNMGGEGGSRKLTKGIFYDAFRPASSRRAELEARANRSAAPAIDESYDVGRIRAARQYSEIPEDYNLRDWKDGVLIRADADLLRKMRDDTSSKVDLLEKRVASLEREPQPLQKGLIEPVRHQLEIERMKLEEIEARIRRVG